MRRGRSHNSRKGTVFVSQVKTNLVTSSGKRERERKRERKREKRVYRIDKTLNVTEIIFHLPNYVISYIWKSKHGLLFKPI